MQFIFFSRSPAVEKVIIDAPSVRPEREMNLDLAKNGKGGSKALPRAVPDKEQGTDKE